MRLYAIFRFELAYQARRLPTWVYFVTLFVVGFVVMRIVTPAEGVLLNTPSFVAFFTVMGGAIWLLLAGAIAGDAAARDVETQMHPLTYTAPVSKTDYLGGRFLAAFVLNAAMLLALQAGILLSLVLPHPQPELIGPFRLAGLLTPYFFIALPNAFVATAVQFSAAVRQRRAIAGYLASVLLIVSSQLVGATTALILGNWGVAKLFDFVGFVSIVREMEAWTPLETNTRLIALEAALLANRVFWLGVALCAMALTYRRFQFCDPVTASPWTRVRPAAFAQASARQADTQSPAPVAKSIAVSTRIAIPRVQRTFAFATFARQTAALAWTSFGTIASSRTGLTLVGVMAIGSALVASEWLLHMEEIPLLPRTEEVITFFTPGLGSVRTIWIVIPLLIMFHAGELIWRERETGVSEIVDTAPVSEWVLFLGKSLGLSLVVVAWMTFLMAAGMLIQVELGYPEFNIGLYLTAFFRLQLADYLLFALLILAVHVVVDQKYLGHVVALAAFGSIAFASWFGIEHHLLIYASDPGWSYSDMRGFGPSLGPWLWFKLYWAAWALLLAVAARLFWARGREASLRVRLRTARGRLTRPTIAVAATAIALVLTLGSFIFYNTNVLNAHHTAAEVIERRAEYERRYEKYHGIPQPRLQGTTLHVEIYPERRSVAIRGTYHLVNRSTVAIDSIHVLPAAGVETGDVAFDRPATRVLVDEDLRYRIYALDQPLLPGASLRLDFEVQFRPRGFSNGGIDPSVGANGSYFSNLWFPAIGYQSLRELSDAGERRAQGLGPRPEMPSLYDADAPLAPSERIDVEAVVGTEVDQIAVAPGILRRTWTERGRRYFHYVTDAPIGNEYSLFSARYAVHESEWRRATGSGQGHVAIQIFHHPRHKENLERMVRSVQASLNYYTEQFGPYPYRHIRIVEYPGRGRGMHADANTITYQEGFSLLNPRVDRGDLDLPFYVVAHEVAHQWWGTQVTPAVVEGAGLLVESLATYSAMRVLEDTLGPEHLRRFLRFARLEYEIPRSRASPPLVRATDSFLYYRKGPLALYALGEYIGKEPVRNALRRLLEKHGSGAPPLPTSLDFYRELQAVTPDSFQYLLRDLFEANTFWELETEMVTAEQTEADSWQVTLDVLARKVAVDESGVETAVTTNDSVEIGIFDDQGLDQPIYLQRHHVSAGKQTLTVIVPRRPTRAGIDPRYLLNDWETGDNVKAVRIQN